MHLALLILALSVLFCDSKPEKKKELFRIWKSKYNKTYDPSEEPLRFQNFKASIERVRERHNLANGRIGAKYGLTKFADLSVREFQETILMRNKITPKEHHVKATNKAVPNFFDWRNSGKVTPVKNQGSCGSCWAFSATETIESAWMIKFKLNNSTMQPLGPQQIVDCDDSDNGCYGGDPPTAYQYVISAGGQETESNYPYTGEDGTCAFNSKLIYASVNSWQYACTNDDETQLLQSAYSYGPTSICVDASLAWQDYSGGVMSAWECAWIVMLDHCVQAVGWNLNAATPYWIVRNSWGSDWGENGYIRLEYGQNTCGLSEEATYVISNSL